MKTTGEILRLSIEFLSKNNIDRARRVSEDLLAHALNLSRMDLYLQYDRPINEEELTLYRERLKRALKDEPVQYIIGEMEFYECSIRVDKRALIPRPETELLVEMILKRASKGVVWDICTGTGCIGIALKKAQNDFNVTLSDISSEALTLARENAERNGVDVAIFQGDLFEPFQKEKADLIVCNPPYVSESEYQELDPSVKNFEPKLALVGGEKGSEFYERFSNEVDAHLNEGGLVFFEIGATQGPALQQLFPSGELINDWAGHPRFFIYAK